MKNAFYGKAVKNGRNRIKMMFVTKYENEKLIKKQSKLNFNGILESYTIYDSYNFKQIQIFMDKPIYLGFVVLELSKLLMYETKFNNFQPNCGSENIQLHYKDSDICVLGIRTQNITNYLQNLKDFFGFSNLKKNHELFSHENKKLAEKFENQTPKTIWIDEFISLENQASLF